MRSYVFNWSSKVDYDGISPLTFCLTERHKTVGRLLPLPGQCFLTLSWVLEEKRVYVTFGLKWYNMRSQVSLSSANLTFIQRDPHIFAKKYIGSTIVMDKGVDGQADFKRFGMGRSLGDGAFDVVLVVELDACKLPMDSLLHLYGATSNDVQLWFPREKITLFANSVVLKAASPYFAEKLVTPLDETSAAAIKIEVEDDDHVGGEAWEDSDDELNENGPPAMPAFTNLVNSNRHPPPTPLPYKLSITEFKARTFLAALHWIWTGQAQFTRLRSLDLPKRPSNLPIPTSSPKSLYHLAHALQLDVLKIKAFNNFRAQLEVGNVAVEMYSSHSGRFDEIRNATTDFASQNWEAVKNSPKMKELLKKMKKEGKTQAQLIVGTELLEKLSGV